MKNYRFLLSGYTRRTNKGIHVLDIRVDKSGVEDHSSLLLELEDPSYLAISGDKLFALSSRDRGGVLAYDFDRDGLNAKLINGVYQLGKAPCHLYFDQQRARLYASNYHLGRLDIFGLDKGGLSLVDSVELEGSGPVSPNQDGPRCHMALMAPNGQHIMVVNLGGDRVQTYAIDGEGGLRLLASYHTKAGMGPRHLVFSPYSKYLYLVGELDSTVEVLSYDECSGRLVHINIVSSLPEAYEGLVGNSGAAIKISNMKNQKGKYNLYVSNRGHDSLSVYEIGDNGDLSLLQNIASGGKNPRDFALTSDEKYLLVGHQDSDDIVIFKRMEDGSLSLVKKLDSRLDEIVCILPFD